MKQALAWILLLLLPACSLLPDWMGEEEDAPLPGKRVAVLSMERELSPDPRLEELEVRLPEAVTNSEWLQVGGNPQNTVEHLALTLPLQDYDTARAGDGTDWQHPLLPIPVVAAGRVFAMDGEGTVSAHNSADIDEVYWVAEVTPEAHEEDTLGGGLAAGGGTVFITTGYGHVLALNAETGAEIWRRELEIPIRAAPKLYQGRVFVTTADNQVTAFDQESGRILWQAAGLSENIGFLGMAVPAIASDTVVVAYSSGELYALHAENGRERWQAMLTSPRQGATSSQIYDITGSPVIKAGWVFAANTSGVLAAMGLREGEFRWEQKIASFATPWIADRFIYVLGERGRVICLYARDGGVKWMTALPEEDEDERTHWYGPVLAGSALLITGNRGTMVHLDPQNGEVIGETEIPDGVRTPPVVAGGAVYLLTESADLVMLQ